MSACAAVHDMLHAKLQRTVSTCRPAPPAIMEASGRKRERERERDLKRGGLDKSPNDPRVIQIGPHIL